METEKIKRIMDACYTAKRIRDMMPELPGGVTSSFIRFLDTINILKEKRGQVRISDISDTMNIPRPGVTRTLKEMESAGYIRKTVSEDDGRITYIDVTEEGKKLSDIYVSRYFNQLTPYFEEISEEDADCMIRTIDRIYAIMCERGKTIIE